MSKSIVGNFNLVTSDTLSPNSTAYAALNYGGSDLGIGTEALVSEEVRLEGTLSRLSARIQANTLTTSTLTIRVRVNSGNGNEVLSITAGSTGWFADTSNSDAVVDGNNINTSFITASGGSGIVTISGNAVNFEATSNYVALMGPTGETNFTSASTTTYSPLSGYVTATATENNIKAQISVAGTYTKAQAYAGFVTRTTATTIRLRINNGNGNIVISCTGSTSGLFEDTSNTDAVVAGDDVNFSVTTGTGAGNFFLEYITVGFLNTTNAKADIYSATSAGIARAASATTHFLGLFGFIDSTAITTEAFANIDVGFTCTASNLRIYLSANTYTIAGTYKSRKNSADGSQTVALTALTTGLFEDVTNSDSLVATDDFCTAIVGGTTASATIQWTGMLLFDTTPPPTAIKTIDGLAKASVKTVNGLAIASVKTVNGLA